MYRTFSHVFMMARRRRVPKKLGPKRIVGEGQSMRIEQTEFCPECELRLQSSATQKPYSVTSMICDNVDGHKNGKIYLWPSENVEILTS